MESTKSLQAPLTSAIGLRLSLSRSLFLWFSLAKTLFQLEARLRRRRTAPSSGRCIASGVRWKRLVVIQRSDVVRPESCNRVATVHWSGLRTFCLSSFVPTTVGAYCAFPFFLIALCTFFQIRSFVVITWKKYAFIVRKKLLIKV